MDKYIYEGKNYEEAVEKALKELNTVEENLIINILEEKNKLLKKSIKIEVINYNDIINYAKQVITDITKLMGINTNLEVRRKDNTIIIKLFTDHNAVIIGKNGYTIQALQTLVKQMIHNKINNNISLVLDVENYKEKRNKNIENLAKKIAREVAKTKVEAKLDRMNSYERRIVHSILADDKYVYTESIGEEPDRYVVIKPKEL